MTWGNEPDFDFENKQRRRKFRDRYGASEDVWGEADAADHYDDGSAEDLSIEGHAAGLDRDYRGYERSFDDRQTYDPYTNPNSAPPRSSDAWRPADLPAPNAPRRFSTDDIPDSAQRFRNRVQSRGAQAVEGNVRAGGRGSGSYQGSVAGDAPSQAGGANRTAVILMVMMMSLSCFIIMTVLAIGGLMRHLGLN